MKAKEKSFEAQVMGYFTDDMAVPDWPIRPYVSPEKRLTVIERKLDDISRVLSK